MAATAATAPGLAPPQSPADFLEALEQARRETLALVASLSEQDLERVHSPIMSPLVWDLGHIAAYEDLWLAHRYAGMPLLRPDLADCYDAFETPRAVRGDIEALGADDARAYLQDVRDRTAAVIRSRGVGDGVICEMVLRHELQHSETMRQTLAIAGLLQPGDEARAAEPLDSTGGQEEWVEIPAGPFALGAAGEGFAYDNELPRHTAETPAFLIASHPVSSESWMRFAEDGGYERREWWSPEGWAWKVENDIAPHPALAASHPLTPACHISWYEADAFARARGARLPSEAEWEKAATQSGALAGVGRVWEWTETRFHGYPGFVAHPYREYSEVFFGDSYHVLRGGSWATHPRVRSLSFRNWDLPLRRQIFAGLRLARDA
jgi:iron(II)-dependent oxidoreductase